MRYDMIWYIWYTCCGSGSSATDKLDGPGIESQFGEIFRLSRPALRAHPAPCTMGAGYFPGVKYGRGVLLTIHPLLVPWSWKSRAILVPTLWAKTGPVTGILYPYLFMIYMLTAIGLTPGGSSTVHIYAQTIQTCRLVTYISISSKSGITSNCNNRHDRTQSLSSRIMKQLTFNTLRTGLLNCLNARSWGLTFRHRASCI